MTYLEAPDRFESSPDWPVRARGGRLERADRIPEGVRVRWSDGLHADFHSCWLRDNCPCTQCRHPATGELVFDQLAIPADVRARSIGTTSTGRLCVEWEPDGHTSCFEPGWLRAHGHTPALRVERRETRTRWDSKFASSLPRFTYRGVVEDEGVRLEFLRAIRRWGLALVLDVPTEPGRVIRVVEEIGGFVLPTNFGVMYDVRVHADPRSNAHTDLALAPHTDLPHHPHPPGVQFFHCLRNDAEGGECILVDGFRVAEAVQREDPKAFEILATRPVDFRYADERGDHRHRGPVIRLDVEGALEEIRFAPNVVAPLDAAFEEIPSLRRAYLSFAAATNRPDFQVRFRFHPGDMLVNDNLRVLHGRTVFDASVGRRHLQGCYMDHSELLSLIRVLERTTR